MPAQSKNLAKRAASVASIATKNGTPADSTPSGASVISHTPIDVRSTSLAILAGLGVIFFLQWARPVLIPITASVMLSYALTPIVRTLQKRLRMPKAVGAAVTLGAILVGLGYGLNALQPQALNVLDILPRAVQKMSAALRGDPRDRTSAVDKLKKAATEIEQAANAAALTAPSASAVVAKQAPSVDTINFRDYVFMGTASVMAGAAQFVVVVCLVYFLLVTGDAFRRTLIRVSGDTLSKKKITLKILDEIDSQIQRYLLVQLATSALLGFVAWAIFAWVGLRDAAVWGFIGGVLHIVPYVGPATFVAVTGLVAFVQFDTVEPVITAIGTVLIAIGVIGFLLVPWLTQRVGRIKAITVFISLLVWGWLWGIWGLLLGVPIVMAVNAVCERVEGLQPISHFLGSSTPNP